MTDFNHRWQAAAQAARRAPNDTDSRQDLPPGFVTRIVTLSQVENVTSPWLECLLVLGYRAVTASALVFFGCAALALWQIDLLPWNSTWDTSPFFPELPLP